MLLVFWVMLAVCVKIAYLCWREQRRDKRVGRVLGGAHAAEGSVQLQRRRIGSGGARHSECRLVGIILVIRYKRDV